MKIRRYKVGYEVRTEKVAVGNNEPILMKNAYNPSGEYIGNSRWAYRLCKIRGIKPEKAKLEHCICSIGFCKKEQKWYGWSHRAIYGFGIGSKVTKGDCAYVPSNPAEIIKELIEEQSMDASLVTTCKKGRAVKVTVPMVYVKLENPDVPEGNQVVDKDRPDCPPDHYIIDTGRGEWEAKTLKDARKMAIDFAVGVS